jgi:DNA-binding transcriptional LysR family regulator
MEMHQIRYFLAVARQLNFTHAAEECHVSQPSLSQAIRKLEEELGGELFRRERSNTHLTDLGRRMAPLLARCYESALAAREMATALKKGVATPLKLALSQTIDLRLLVSPLTEMTRSFAGVELKFLRGNAEAVVQFLKAGDCDLAVAGHLGEEWERLDSWLLFSEGFQLVVERDHTLVGRNQVGLQDIAGTRVFARSHCENASDFASLLAANGATSGASDEIGSDQDLLRLVEAGIGVGILPQSAAIAPSLQSVMLNDVTVRREVRLYAVAGRQRSPAAAALIKILRAADWTRVVRESLALA